MITSAELTLYNEDDDCWSVDLSEWQLKAIITILGITEATENSVTCFSDEKIKDILKHGILDTKSKKKK